MWIALVMAAAAHGAAHRAADVVVYVHHGTEPPEVIAIAEAQAGRMLAGAGIKLQWELGTPRCHGRAEVIEVVLTAQADDKIRPGALACATLGKNSGPRVEIFYNRVRAAGPAATVPAILAHVLAHEIAHVVEGVGRHSETGVMKAHWVAADFYAMRTGSLPFAAEDVRLIGEWAARKRSAQLTADSGPALGAALSSSAGGCRL